MAPSKSNRSVAVYNDFVASGSNKWVSGHLALKNSLRTHYPDYNLTVVMPRTFGLIAFAKHGKMKLEPNCADSCTDIWKSFTPSSRDKTGGQGHFSDRNNFLQYDAEFEGEPFIAFWATVYEGNCLSQNWYLLHKTSEISATGSSVFIERLVETVAKWEQRPEQGILVFDRMMWTSSSKLYKTIEATNWDSVVFDAARKRNMISDVEGFFDRKDAYRKLSAPWKRGILLHGPPGNGKTTSIKAMVRNLSHRETPIPSLYVKSLRARQGTDFSIDAIERVFEKAREMAPCVLIFEDIDSVITDKTRTYFLNEVDGIESNEGILMVGSTNNLDKLDPGLSKRPSRFDRKYLFGNPDLALRQQYCNSWRQKLQAGGSVAFPESLSEEVAKITDGFSFAYLQELFVSTLLGFASSGTDEIGWEKVPNEEDGDLTTSVLGRALAAQVETLRKEMGEATEVVDALKKK